MNADAHFPPATRLSWARPERAESTYHLKVRFWLWVRLCLRSSDLLRKTSVHFSAPGS